MGIVTNTTDPYQKCIDACNQCMQACYECLKLCLGEPDVQKRTACIGTLMECACICKEAASFMSMNAQFSKDLCKLCSTICLKCAAECAMFTDDHCQKCANQCNLCAQECTMMAK